MLAIRPIADADVEAVAALHVRAWQTGYAGIVPQSHLDSLDPAIGVERLRARKPVPGSHTLVAEENGHILGFVVFGPYRGENDPAAGELHAIYVDPSAWSRGVGRELLTAARRGLTEAGYAEMRLWVLEENANARRFYERMGLAPDGRTHYYTPRGTDVELPELRYATAL